MIRSGPKQSVRAAIVVLLCNFVTEAYSSELIESRTGVQEKLADSLVDRALEASPLHYNCLENTVLAKTHSNMNGMRSGSPITVRVAQPCFALNHLDAWHSDSSLPFERGRKYLRTRSTRVEKKHKHALLWQRRGARSSAARVHWQKDNKLMEKDSDPEMDFLPLDDEGISSDTANEVKDQEP